MAQDDIRRVVGQFRESRSSGLTTHAGLQAMSVLRKVNGYLLDERTGERAMESEVRRKRFISVTRDLYNY